MNIHNNSTKISTEIVQSSIWQLLKQVCKHTVETCHTLMSLMECPTPFRNSSSDLLPLFYL